MPDDLGGLPDVRAIVLDCWALKDHTRAREVGSWVPGFRTMRTCEEESDPSSTKPDRGKKIGESEESMIRRAPVLKKTT